MSYANGELNVNETLELLGEGWRIEVADWLNEHTLTHPKHTAKQADKKPGRMEFVHPRTFTTLRKQGRIKEVKSLRPPAQPGYWQTQAGQAR